MPQNGIFSLFWFSLKEKKWENIHRKKKKILPRKSFQFLSFFFGIKIISFHFFSFCCVFWPATSCFAHCSLVKIILWAFSHRFSCFSVKRKKKHTKSFANKLIYLFLLFDGERQKRFATPKVIHLIPLSKETKNPHPQQHHMGVCQVPYFTEWEAHLAPHANTQSG